MLNTPDELDLLSFFEAEPVEATPEDGYYCYKASDRNNIDIFLSFDKFGESIQVRLVFSGKDIAIFSEENAQEIKLENDASGEYLSCSFGFQEISSKATIHLRPDIQVKWHILKN